MKNFISGNLQFEPYRRTVQVESSRPYVAIEKGCFQRHIPPNNKKGIVSSELEYLQLYLLYNIDSKDFTNSRETYIYIHTRIKS